LEPLPASRNKPRRFSHESLNDLLFWGVQLLVVAISIAIMYTKLENTAAILRTLLSEQDGELQIAKAQALKADGIAEEARQAAHKAEIQRSVAFDTAEQRMADLLAQVNQIQADVKDALEKSTQTNQLVLEAAQASKKAAEESKVAAGSAATEASRAAGTAGAAVSAATRAAALSSRTGAVVANKIVTTSDKRALEAQQRALARKQAQLSRTIQQVKKNGPNLLQQIFH
jgi:hypothetical protein